MGTVIRTALATIVGATGYGVYRINKEAKSLPEESRGDLIKRVQETAMSACCSASSWKERKEHIKLVAQLPTAGNKHPEDLIFVRNEELGDQLRPLKFEKLSDEDREDLTKGDYQVCEAFGTRIYILKGSPSSNRLCVKRVIHSAIKEVCSSGSSSLPIPVYESGKEIGLLNSLRVEEKERLCRRGCEINSGVINILSKEGWVFHQLP